MVSFREKKLSHTERFCCYALVSTLVVLLSTVVFSILAVTKRSTTSISDGTMALEARERSRVFGDRLMERILADDESHPLVYALAGLYTGTDPAGANTKIRLAWEEAAGPDGTMTPERAGAEEVKWSMRGWLRIYYLFRDGSDYYGGGLEPDVQAKMEEMFFLYGSFKSTVQRTDLDNIWFIQGSENHDMMDLSNAYLALQAVQHLEQYKDQMLSDGETPSTHVKAWEMYYARYALERARNGLYVEISPTYGKWFVGELVNMADFAESPLVRKRMEMLLHLTWADWSIDQLDNGVRGGGRTRVYQGKYSQQGDLDSWDAFGRAFTGREGWYMTNHGILSYMAMVTSPTYRVPDAIMEISLNRGNKTEPFVYQSSRPAKLGMQPRNAPDTSGYWMDKRGGLMVRYSYWTPACVLGSWMLDSDVEYAAINTQNRWEGVVFSTGRDTRVFPQSVGLGNNNNNYDQHIGVQHRNVMLVAQHPRARQAGPMRVYFPTELRERVVERDGWVLLQEGNAWMGVRVLRNNLEVNYRFEKGIEQGYWLSLEDSSEVVAFVVSQVRDYRTVDDFFAYVYSHEYVAASGHATYAFADDIGVQKRLELGGDLAVPTVDQRAVDLRPNKVFDSPFLSSEHGSGIVVIQRGEHSLVLDFNSDVAEEGSDGSKPILYMRYRPMTGHRKQETEVNHLSVLRILEKIAATSQWPWTLAVVVIGYMLSVRKSSAGKTDVHA